MIRLLILPNQTARDVVHMNSCPYLGSANIYICYNTVSTEVPIKKKLSAVGNSFCLVIEKPILELLNIDRDTELEMTTDGARLIIEPIRNGKKSFRASASKLMKKHDATFRKLAK